MNSIYVRHYNNVRNQYTLVSSKNSYRYMTYDLKELIECPNCHKKVKAGKAYTSRFWFAGSGLFGLFGLMVCKDCHDEENKILSEVRSHLEKTTKQQFLESIGYCWSSAYRGFIKHLDDKFKLYIYFDEKEEQHPSCKVVPLIHFYNSDDIDQLAKALQEVRKDFDECKRYK